MTSFHIKKVKIFHHKWQQYDKIMICKPLQIKIMLILFLFPWLYYRINGNNIIKHDYFNLFILFPINPSTYRRSDDYE